MKKEGEKHKSVVAGLQGQVQEIQRQLEQAKQVRERERDCIRVKALDLINKSRNSETNRADKTFKMERQRNRETENYKVLDKVFL